MPARADQFLSMIFKLPGFSKTTHDSCSSYKDTLAASSVIALVRPETRHKHLWQNEESDTIKRNSENFDGLFVTNIHQGPKNYNYH
ncbi:hypothetical protein N7456_012286 [Penicillium angulare]|uniref:Uncharacterized protein n=1 Tax=Penicillium angulare TaxID=116970 RepID=A0A9W9EVK6_9EURO|nr:hypothetical protein N7456_012286 [Penicillium angulare]